VTRVEHQATYARQWTRAEFERLVDAGFFRADEPVELIGGQLIVSEPQGSPHAAAVGLAGDALRAAFGRGWTVREEKPVALDDDSEPEPDLVVVPGTHRNYAGGHPARPVLVVEIADSSLRLDREHKASLYARAGLADYWIVNLVDRVLEVYRQPVADPSASFGWRYASRESLGLASSIAPLAAPETRILVSDLFP